MFAVAAFLGASADVARTLQTFLIPFQKDVVKGNVPLDEALGCRLLLPSCLLSDEDTAGNGENDDGWNVLKSQSVFSGFGSPDPGCWRSVLFFQPLQLISRLLCADLCAWLRCWLLLRAHTPGLEQQIPLQVEQASADCGGGFPQVVLSDHGHAPGQVEMITPRDRHGRLLATLQFGEGFGQTQLHAEQGPRHQSPARKTRRRRLAGEP